MEKIILRTFLNNIDVNLTSVVVTRNIDKLRDAFNLLEREGLIRNDTECKRSTVNHGNRNHRANEHQHGNYVNRYNQNNGVNYSFPNSSSNLKTNVINKNRGFSGNFRQSNNVGFRQNSSGNSLLITCQWK